MTNKFTTPCFVRVEDAEKRKELIEWLAQIGYRLKGPILNDNLDCIVTGADAALSTNMERFDFWITSVPYVSRIDCGTNVELFKALAAMNAENNRKQWFVAKCDINDHGAILWHERDLGLYDEVVEALRDLFRKATAKELINHFKD